MTNQTADDLRTRAQVNGHYVTACSPSAGSVQIMWPDRTVQTVEMGKTPTVAIRETGEECWIYWRGPSYDAILAEIDSETQRQEDEIQEVLADIQKQSEERVEGVMRANPNVVIVIEEVTPQSALCNYEGEHHDCELCPDPETGEAPKHHSTAPKLAGHKRSNLHKKFAEEAS